MAVPADFVLEQARTICRGPCPTCGGPGPNDVHTAHTIWSALVTSSASSTPHVCCTKCGRSVRRRATLFCLLFGWWGFPHGLVGTPVQVLRNLRGPAPSLADEFGEPIEPSPELVDVVRTMLAKQWMTLN